MIKRTELHKNSKEFIGYREDVEWLNYWRDNANQDNNDKRVLLLGDSFLRMCRKQIASLLDCPVDFIGVSGMINDEMVLREIELFFSFYEYKYSMIYFQLGCHGCVQEKGEELDELFYEDYALQYEYVVKYLEKKTKKLIIGTNTQIVDLKNYRNPIIRFLYLHFHSAIKEKVDNRYEIEILRRNAIVRDTSKKYNICFNDMYSYMLNDGKNIRHTDHVHYPKYAQMFIAKRICSFLNGEKYES